MVLAGSAMLDNAWLQVKTNRDVLLRQDRARSAQGARSRRVQELQQFRAR